MTDLSEFLLARIAEDEAAARTMIDNEAWVSDCNEPHDARIEMWDQTATIRTWLLDGRRLLAECEAKRRIVEHCQDGLTEASSMPYGGASGLAEDTLKLLALPYADHADYRAEWRP